VPIAPAAEIRARILDSVRAGGLDAVGIAAATPFAESRQRIVERKERGLHGGMWFTYGRPERSTDPQRILAGAKSIIVAAMSYYRAEPTRIATLPDSRQGDSLHDTSPATDAAGVEGAIARYAWQHYYEMLRGELAPIAQSLEDAGWKAEVVIDDNRLVDRAAAYRAGLGWFGKNTNLLLPGRGSWFVLGSVVTDCELAPTEGPVDDGCGTCNRCQVSCPTGALDEPGVLDARRCLAWLVQASGVFPVEYREALGDRMYGCDDCQEVCPPNARSMRSDSDTNDPATPVTRPTVDVIELLALDDDLLMERLGHWYIPRRRPEYIRRNALIVLGNVADSTRAEVRETVKLALVHESSIVRAHAVWAAKRLGYLDLIEWTRSQLDLQDDEHPADNEVVRAELAADVAERGQVER